MIHVVQIHNAPSPAVRQLIQEVSTTELTGFLYVSYPNPSRESDQPVIDALLVTEELGVILFDTNIDRHRIHDPDYAVQLDSRFDDLYFSIANKLEGRPELRKNRQLAVPIHTIRYTGLPAILASPAELNLVSRGDIANVLQGLPHVGAAYFGAVVEVIQNIAAVKPQRKRSEVTRPDSRGGILRQIEANLTKMDIFQTTAAMETPDGAERIRGLAGSGKTIVLALKAALLHRLHPDWKIGITFYTRSLYQHFERLISRLYYDISGDDVDFEAGILLRHCWGSVREPGIYSDLAVSTTRLVYTYDAAKAKFGEKTPFDGVCSELLAQLAETSVDPTYDLLLIDEAQDLPRSFFRMAHMVVKNPKRIVWAYDELQHLGDLTMPPPTELFGTGSDGNPLVSNHRDVILPTCYRNTEWALSAAHAFGFGVYRFAGLCQMFDDPGMWQDIGYERVGGDFVVGDEVSIRRNPDASPSYYKELLSEEDAVTCTVFSSVDEQANWVADQIKINIESDELRASDILVVFPDARTFRGDAGRVVRALLERRISAHLVGISSSRDEVFIDNSVALAHIHRAKGNEAPMVYVLNAEYGFTGFDLIKRRNAIFTAITRSRGWVRVCGVGSGMEHLKTEFEKLRTNDFRLQFTVPSLEQLKSMRSIGRDRPEQDIRLYSSLQDSVETILERMEGGELDWGQFPPEVVDRLRKSLRGSD